MVPLFIKVNRYMYSCIVLFDFRQHHRQTQLHFGSAYKLCIAVAKILTFFRAQEPKAPVTYSPFSSSRDTTVQNLDFTRQTTDITHFADVFHYNVIRI